MLLFGRMIAFFIGAIVQKFGAEEFRKFEKEIYTACNQKCSHIHNAKFKT